MKKQPWERLDSESEKAYQAFAIFRELGADRSIPAVQCRYRAGTLKSAKVLHRWSSKFAWFQRAAAYDANQEAIQRAADDEIRKQTAEKWSTRREERLDSAYDEGMATIAVAKLLLSMPPLERIVTQRDPKTGAEIAVTVSAHNVLHFCRAAAMLYAGQKRVEDIIESALNVGREDRNDPTGGLPALAHSMPEGPPAWERAKEQYNAWFEEKWRRVAGWDAIRHSPPKEPTKE